MAKKQKPQSLVEIVSDAALTMGQAQTALSMVCTLNQIDEAKFQHVFDAIKDAQSQLLRVSSLFWNSDESGDGLV